MKAAQTITTNNGNNQPSSRIIQETKFRAFVRENLSILSITAVLILICLFFAIMTSSFFTLSNASNLIIQIAPNIIVAVMMTFVITTGGIDLSVGSILALASALAAILLDAGLGSFLTLLVVLAAGLTAGLLNGYVVAYFGIPPLIVTLAAMIYIRGIALLLTGGYSIAILSEHWLTGLGQGKIAGIPVAVILSVICVVLGMIFLRFTRYGNYVTGIGANEESVRRSGVNTKKVKLITYMLSGASAALAGLIIAARLGSGSSNIGTMFEMDVIAAVVLGGTALFGGAGTIAGTVIGVALIGVIQNGLTLMHVSPFIIQIIEGFVLLLAVIINIRVFGKKS